MQGIWPPMKNCKDFYPICADKSKDENVLIAGSLNGLIKVFPFPIVSNQVSDSFIYETYHFY